jgi:hypothetical protein
VATTRSRKKAAPVEQTAPEGTDYVVIEMDGNEPKRVVGRVNSKKGTDAIKAVAVNPSTGEYQSGVYKAVAANSWDSPGNNMTITVEVKPVVSFSSPNGNGSEPEPAPEPEAEVVPAVET